jgi:cell division septation protein DedD
MTVGGSRHRFELTRLEIAGLVVSSAASLFIVFLLGVYAGRSLGVRDLADEERVVRLPIAPAAEEAPARDDDLTFDDMLSSGDRLGARSPAASGGGHAPTDARAPVEVQTPAREHPAVPAAPALAARPPDEGGVRLQGDSTARAAAESGPGARPAEARVAAAPAPAAEAASASPFKRGEWSVQVTATREAQTADDMVRRLRAKGYDAYIVKIRRQGSTFYRVRVGHFSSVEHAGQMVSRLRREPGVPEAFVASD